MDVCIGGRPVLLDPATAIGKGGEADIYALPDGRALKIFKGPDHPDYQGQPGAQQAARERIVLHQRKLRLFPLPLPDRVVQPQELATDPGGRTIIGYVMRLVRGATPLARYGDRPFRQVGGVPNGTVVALFRDLHATVGAVHRAGVVIGDVNDLNVLVVDTAAYLIDTDSYGFGPFPCTLFTARFVDPLLCDVDASGLTLRRPHSPDSDWYAFSVLLMQSLLYVDPYGGVYRPPAGTARLRPGGRQAHRITVFHPDVRYPRPAAPPEILPDDLLAYFHDVFERDRRGPFPPALLDGLRWTSCPACGTEHARAVCPACRHLVPGPPLVRRGTVGVRHLFQTHGLILHAAAGDARVRWLYHEDGAYRREGGAVVVRAPLDPRTRYRLHGEATLLGREGQLTTYAPGRPPERMAVDACGARPLFDANDRARYWVAAGRLWRDGPWGPEGVGDVLAGQTLFWVGPAFGFGFYRAGALGVSFVFDAARRGINDTLALALPRGEILDATCAFSADRCWFFVAVREGGRTVNRCTVLRPDGAVEATSECEGGDGSWLGTAGRGACAAGSFLLAPTDEGVVRVEVDHGRIVPARLFADTAPFVDAGCRLLPGPDGLYVVDRREIRVLAIA